MRNVWIGIGFALILALVGWSQCVELSCLSFDGPSVAFKLCVQVAGATCSNVPKPPPTSSDTVRCSVSEGASGTVDLTVNRTAPGSFMGGIVLTGSVPAGWPTFTPVSKSGAGNMSVTAQYRFSVPPGTAGRSFELKFKAVADGCYGELILTVILDVAGPSGPRLYGPYTGTTNENGRFSVPIRDLLNTQVGGTLTECTVRVLPRTPVTIYVAADMPTFGSPGFVWASYPMTPLAQQAPRISYILISAPGYPQVKVTQFFVLPIIVGGTTYFMVDVGTVSLPALTCQAQPPGGGIPGTTDSAGNFRVNVGSGITVSGRLTECTVKPLPNQTFTVVPKFSGEELDEVKFVVPGYADTTVTKAVSVVHLGAMKYINLGDVCMVPQPPCICQALDIRTGNVAINAWLHSFEITGERAWVQVDVYLPVTWTMRCGPEGARRGCEGFINVNAASKFGPTGYVPTPEQAKLCTPKIRCWWVCPQQRTVTRYVRYSFVVEGKKIIGFPFAEMLPFDGVITFTLTTVCPGATAGGAPVVAQVPISVSAGGPPLNPNPPLPPPPPAPIPIPVDPAVERDPYVAEIESIDPLPGAALVSVRVGNSGTQAALGRLAVTVLLESGGQSVGRLDDLVFPSNMEFTVQVSVPIPPRPGVQVWPPASAAIAEIMPDSPDDNPQNNRAEWP